MAMAYYNGLMAGNRFVKELKWHDKKSAFGYLFRDRKGRDVLMLGILQGDTRQVGLHLDGKRVTVADMYETKRKSMVLTVFTPLC